MKSRSTSVAFAFGLACSLVACRGGGSGDDEPGIDAPPVALDVTVQEIQDDAMSAGTQVSLRGVVVTAIDAYGNRTGAIWVQEPTGGEFSGVKVFGAPLDQVASLAPGDLVDITNAQKDEFACTAAICGADFDPGFSITELEPVEGGTMNITKTGTGTVPGAAVVDAAALAALPKAERDAEWEKWEGVLIKVVKARQIAAVRAFGGADSGPDENEFRATGFVRVQSALAALPDTAVFGVCYESITGVGDYFFNWILAPRTASDIVTGGTECNPIATSVVALQSATTTPEVVDLTNVVVTARDDLGTTTKGFWVSDALAGAANNGVYVFTRDVAPDAALVIGARVNVQGAVDEFDLNGPNMTPPSGDTVTEVVNPVLSNIQAAAGPPIPAMSASVETLSAISSVGEPWEGVLVRIGPVKVTNSNAGAGKVELTDNNGKKILADDESFVFSPQNSPVALNTCYAQFTGVMHVQVNDDVRTINPRSAADLITGGGCN